MYRPKNGTVNDVIGIVHVKQQTKY